MVKRMIIMLLLVGVVAGGLIGFNMFKNKMMGQFMAKMGSAPQTVSTVKAGKDSWSDSLEAVGSLRAVKGVDISPEVAGIVEDIKFDSGDNASAGQVLLTLRANDDRAKLESLQASVKLAETNLKRDKAQLKTQAIAQAAVDTDAANVDIAKAQAAEQQALLDKKTIHAPFDGLLGVRAVDLGQYLNPGTAIVTLQEIDPIYFDFTLPQQSVSAIKTGQKIQVRTDAWPGKSFDGEIAAISPKVDPTTRNVQVRAELKNPDHKLLPGMYAAASLSIGEPQEFITLPQAAVTYNPYGSTVYLVEKGEGGDDKSPALTAKQAFVTLGEARGDQVAVTKGINDGDEVVVAGQNKLHNGASIAVNNDILPSSDPNPKPQEQ